MRLLDGFGQKPKLRRPLDRGYRLKPCRPARRGCRELAGDTGDNFSVLTVAGNRNNGIDRHIMLIFKVHQGAALDLVE